MADFWPHRPVDVLGAVLVETPAGRIAVEGHGRTIGLRVDSWSAVRRLAALVLRRPRPERRLAFTRIARALTLFDVALTLQLGRREIARLEPGLHRGLSATVLALPGLAVSTTSLLRALVARPNARS